MCSCPGASRCSRANTAVYPGAFTQLPGTRTQCPGALWCSHTFRGARTHSAVHAHNDWVHFGALQRIYIHEKVLFYANSEKQHTIASLFYSYCASYTIASILTTKNKTKPLPLFSSAKNPTCFGGFGGVRCHKGKIQTSIFERSYRPGFASEVRWPRGSKVWNDEYVYKEVKCVSC